MSDTRLLRALRAILPALLPREPFLGPRRYRVVRMRPSPTSTALTRVELQILDKATGLPDLLFVPPWPGLAGSSSELTPGAIVLVEFIDGNRQQPIVTHFSTADDPAWIPVNTRIDATSSITIGGGTPPKAARVGDSVDAGRLSVTMGPSGVATVIWIPPQAPHTPVTVATSPLSTPITGLIATGSSKVGIE